MNKLYLSLQIFGVKMLDLDSFLCFRFMNKRVPSNKRYQPTEYEHAANCATHAVSVHLSMHHR